MPRWSLPALGILLDASQRCLVARCHVCVSCSGITAYRLTFRVIQPCQPDLRTQPMEASLSKRRDLQSIPLESRLPKVYPACLEAVQRPAQAYICIEPCEPHHVEGAEGRSQAYGPVDDVLRGAPLCHSCNEGGSSRVGTFFRPRRPKGDGRAAHQNSSAGTCASAGAAEAAARDDLRHYRLVDHLLRRLAARVAAASKTTGCGATADQAATRQAAAIPACKHPFTVHIAVDVFRCAGLPDAGAAETAATAVGGKQGRCQPSLRLLAVR